MISAPAPSRHAPPDPSAARLLERVDALARVSEQADGLTRVYLSPQHAEANHLVGGWMAEAGMAVRVDAAGNLVGRREGVRPDLPCLMLGSHLDSVRNAGRYDGMLGVLTAIECVEALGERALSRRPSALNLPSLIKGSAGSRPSTIKSTSPPSKPFLAKVLPR